MVRGEKNLPVRGWARPVGARPVFWKEMAPLGIRHRGCRDQLMLDDVGFCGSHKQIIFFTLNGMGTGMGERSVEIY